jgi:hypothetical protein
MEKVGKEKLRDTFCAQRGGGVLGACGKKMSGRIAVRWFVGMAGGLNWLNVLQSGGCGENFRSMQELRMCLSA